MTRRETGRVIVGYVIMQTEKEGVCYKCGGTSLLFLKDMCGRCIQAELAELIGRAGFEFMPTSQRNLPA